MLKRTGVFLAAIAFATIVSPPANAIVDILDIGSRLELFVDDWLIDQMDGVRLELKKPIDVGKVMDFNEPWEGSENNYMHIFQDGDKWRMYYRAA